MLLSLLRPVLIIVAALFFGTAANAKLTAKKCQEMGSDVYHVWSEQPSDLGQGFVLDEGSFSYEGDFSASVVLTHCKSGLGLRATTRAHEGEKIVVKDVTPQSRVTISQAIVSAEKFTLGDLVRNLNRLGAKAKLFDTAQAVENCGCAVFYPERRGNKEAYEARQ